MIVSNILLHISLGVRTFTIRILVDFLSRLTSRSDRSFTFGCTRCLKLLYNRNLRSQDLREMIFATKLIHCQQRSICMHINQRFEQISKPKRPSKQIILFQLVRSLDNEFPIEPISNAPQCPPRLSIMMRIV